MTANIKRRSVFIFKLNVLLNEHSNIISVIGSTRCTICFQFITINSLYIFRALICSSSGVTVCTTTGIFCEYYVGWLLAGLEWKHVEAINRNELKENSASCLFYYTEQYLCLQFAAFFPYKISRYICNISIIRFKIFS
jgi:hypothetical protein